MCPRGVALTELLSLRRVLLIVVDAGPVPGLFFFVEIAEVKTKAVHLRSTREAYRDTTWIEFSGLPRLFTPYARHPSSMAVISALKSG